MAENYTPLPAHEWQVPPQAVAESYKIGWLNESVEEGQAWLKSQRGYGDFKRALNVIAGNETSTRPLDYRSRLNTNPLKRDVREVVGTMSRLRPFWGYHSDNQAYSGQAQMMNKVTRALYLENFYDLAIKSALKFAAATCLGWVRPVYRRDMYGTGQGRIQLLTYGSPCVLPNQLPQTGDWQSAYVVHILEEMPVAMAHGMFPRFQHRLNPSSSRYWYMSDNVRKSSQGNWLTRAFGKGKREGAGEAQADRLVPIRYTHVIDLAINTTKEAIPMGEAGTSWSYTVPFVGQQLTVGRDAHSGSPIYRVANENDARLYPYRRTLISSDICELYDGPSFDWHGMLPLASFSMDSWPWEPLGFSLVHEGYEINEAIKEINRGNMDKVRAQLDPALAFDNNVVGMKEARGFDPLMPRARIGFDGSATEGQVFQQPIPEEFLKITPESMAFVEYLRNALSEQMAIKDVMALAKMRAAGSMDELEKIVESNGPIIEELSRSMEPPMRDIGVMLKYLVLQHMTTSRIMQYVGADGVTPEVFDYDPTSLVPSHLPGEEAATTSPTEKVIRARTFADNLRFFILPNSLHEITQTLMKLGLIQLKKAGVKIDSQTIAEAWQVANYGTIKGNTVIERWQAEQEMDLEFAARMQEIAGSLGVGQPPGGAAPGKKPEGRPSTDAHPPKLESKDGGARSTISTSK